MRIGESEREHDLAVDPYLSCCGLSLLSLTRQMQRAGRLLAELDAVVSLGRVAAHHAWCRPKPCDHDKAVASRHTLRIRDLVHPSVQRALGSASAFIPNDANVEGLVIITGPNWCVGTVENNFLTYQ